METKEEYTKQFDDKIKELNGVKATIEKSIKQLQAIWDPKREKECKHNSKPAKIMQNKRGEVVIKFSTELEADNFYNEFGK